MTDAYSVLGVSPDANQAEIETAYKERLTFLHPDRAVGRSESERKVAAAMLADLQTAWSLVGDVRARARYDAERSAPERDVRNDVPQSAPEPEDEWVVVDEPEPPSSWQQSPQQSMKPARPGIEWPWTLRAVTWPVRFGWRRAGRRAERTVIAAWDVPVLFWWGGGAVGLSVTGFIVLLVAIKISNTAALVAMLAGGAIEIYWAMVGIRALSIKIRWHIARRLNRR